MEASGYDPLVHLLCRVAIVAVRRQMDDEADRILRHVRRRVANRAALETSLALAQSLRGDHAIAERTLLDMLAGDPDSDALRAALGVVSMRRGGERWRSYFEGILATSMDAEMRHLAYASLNGTHNHHYTGS
ncbi:MAG: hypothetical protein ACTHL1_10270 [Burkholderiaceae bacterium]